jgi:thioredoxin 1
MQIFKILTTAVLALTCTLALALDIQPYTAPALAQLQQTNQAVAVHFHADWCPTCLAQERVLRKWIGDASVPGTVLVANYDTEKDLKRQMGVRTQSTLVVFKGTLEKARLAGNTDAPNLRAALLAAQ